MKLPNVERAVVADSKLTEYLLSTTHAEGKEKAVVFFSRGFSVERLDELRQALLQVAQENPVTQSSETVHGMKFVVEGRLRTPNGLPLSLRTIWMIDRGGTIPRLISAYPL
ncbi:MAG: hypothetical protein Q8922_03860 [Bacteroidota bacterium]|nr:hypothetical protein [Bacteroidota bacterium]MDP4233429.1 hypothetical protein [Bacteroidota bacterium]MDP4242295.1 hypothetical protein [Bacteroidota bacterium]MDP4287051.1 hypothetical protein [Bacteroidota bacterium]